LILSPTLPNRRYAVDGDEVNASFSKDEKLVAVDVETLAELVGGDLSIFDFDGDGKNVTAQQVFEKLDTNHDGSVSVKEFLKVFDPSAIRENRRRLSTASLGLSPRPKSVEFDGGYSGFDSNSDNGDSSAFGSPTFPEDDSPSSKPKKQRKKKSRALVEPDPASAAVPTVPASKPKIQFKKSRAPAEKVVKKPKEVVKKPKLSTGGAAPPVRASSTPSTRPTRKPAESVSSAEFGDWVPGELPEDEHASSEFWEAGLFDEDDILPRLSTDLKVLDDILEVDDGGKRDTITKKPKKSKKSNKTSAKGGADDADDSDEEDEKDEDEENEENDEGDEDDEDGGITGPQHVKYRKPPPMSTEPILDVGELEKGDQWPKGEENDTNILLAKLIKARKKWVKMGLRRNSTAGIKAWIDCVEIHNSVFSNLTTMSADELNLRNKNGSVICATLVGFLCNTHANSANSTRMTVIGKR
jgi:hypothetical protein